MRNLILVTSVFASSLFAVGCGSCPDARDSVRTQCPCGVIPNSTINRDADGCAVFACMDCSDAQQPYDMSSFPGCLAIATCVNACSSVACAQSCEANASSLDVTHFQEALSCGQAWCEGVTSDGGVGRCERQGDQLVDPPGAPAGTCQRCLDDALAPIFGQKCSSPTSPDCDPAACHNLREACGVP